jgi:hypothetical protein
MRRILDKEQERLLAEGRRLLGELQGELQSFDAAALTSMITNRKRTMTPPT